jgi:hypothetical protein
MTGAELENSLVRDFSWRTFSEELVFGRPASFEINDYTTELWPSLPHPLIIDLLNTRLDRIIHHTLY